ncbi:MAG: response regulator [Spirochaetaceae bacterium]|nr:MAG: response regulator [Spirochaetaceae bacterium]
MPRKSDGSYVFSALEVAEICGNFANQTAINWIKRGHLKAFQTPGGQYRVYADDLIDFLQTRGMRIPEQLQSLVGEIQQFDTVLVVEGDDEQLKSLRSFLHEEYPQHTVFLAENYFVAGYLVARHSPAVILLDAEINGIDAETVCGMIRNESSSNDPIIIASVVSDDQERSDSLRAAGCDGIITKEKRLDDLPALLASLVQQRNRAFRRPREVV